MTEKIKPIAFVHSVKFHCGEDGYSSKEGVLVMNAIMVVDATDRRHRGIDSDEVLLTTPVVKIDLENRTVETLNTIYKIIPACQAEATRLLVPEPKVMTTSEKLRKAANEVINLI